MVEFQVEHFQDLLNSAQGQNEEIDRVNKSVMRENVMLREDYLRMERTATEQGDRLRMMEARMGSVEGMCRVCLPEVINLSDDLSEYDLGSPDEEDEEKENVLPLEAVLVPDVLDEPYILTLGDALAPAQRDGRGILQEIVEKFEGTVAGGEFGEAGWEAINSLYN